ncbi:hypothetical protein ANN_01868 [Periplaneta americana]|uniref:Uncharacterized protein n=1 Tax=Periplaneta americana TaxID=6978 RepID=A0ABQ8TUT0_PERAM|nr:hypothetical protein ANN_01868 [Periplaneta americana]
MSKVWYVPVTSSHLTYVISVSNVSYISREEAVFRVFVVMPLLPGFEGEIGTPSGTALHAITHWNYASISR